ncbi:MAG: pseudouridine synthase [Flavipsychrobacter sp.]|nr:pseudouridine synthase [Flavipsychrobacter sp.]
MSKQQYYIFYKPYMVMSQFSPEGEKQTLAHYLSHLAKDIYPVGRLDYDSEGLLLLTNDTILTHRLLEPKFAHKRTYWVQVDGDASDEAIAQLCNGVIINNNGKDYKTKPAIAKKINEPEVTERNPPIRYRKNIPTSWISLTLTEGKNRQVRKMTAKVGFPTLRLIRYSIGKVTIENMQPGKCIEVDKNIVQKLLAN